MYFIETQEGAGSYYHRCEDATEVKAFINKYREEEIGDIIQVSEYLRVDVDDIQEIAELESITNSVGVDVTE